jgi:hypothetical protein
MKRAFAARRGLGFTIVELLVVIGIISVLIAVMLPSLKEARETALKLRCTSNIRQNGMMAINFTADNKGKFPSSFVSNVPGTQLYAYTTQPLLSYNGCPFKGKGTHDATGWSYSILDAYRSDTVAWPNWGNWVRMEKIRKPTQSALGIECYINQTYSPIYWETNTLAEGRHDGEGLNVVFPDAHVEFLKGYIPDGAGNYIGAEWRTRFPSHSIPQTVTTIPWNTTPAQPRAFCWFYNGCF